MEGLSPIVDGTSSDQNERAQVASGGKGRGPSTPEGEEAQTQGDGAGAKKKEVKKRRGWEASAGGLSSGYGRGLLDAQVLLHEDSCSFLSRPAALLRVDFASVFRVVCVRFCIFFLVLCVLWHRPEDAARPQPCSGARLGGMVTRLVSGFETGGVEGGGQR